MDRSQVLGISTLIFAAFATPNLSAGQHEITVKGEVIQVQEQVQTGNRGESDQLWIRTRQGDQVRLQMGRAGSCPGCVQVGDQIRARVRSGGQIARVRSIKVRRNGSMYNYRFQGGELLQNQARLRARDGGNRAQNSAQQWQRGTGNANCRGKGNGSRGSGAGGSGNSRGGGGG